MTDTRSPGPWTLNRVARELPDLAPLATLHAAIESAFRDDERTHGHVHPTLAGTPGVHWMLGRPLIYMAERAGFAERMPGLVRAAGNAVATTAPAGRDAVEETLGGPAFAGLA